MRVVYVCSNYLPFVGGVEIHARQVAQWMGKRHDVTIAARNFTAGPHSDALAVLHHNWLTPSWPDSMDGSIPVRSLTPDWRGRLLMAPMALRATPKLRRWFYHGLNRATHPFYHRAIAPKLENIVDSADVVHSLAHGDLGWSAEVIARRHRVPFVCTPFVHPNQWGDGPDDRKFYRRCEAVIGLVNSDGRYLKSLGVESSRVRVIGVSPNLAGNADGTRFREKHGLGGKRIVLYVGRMMAQKGASAMVQAARSAEAQPHDYAFVFIGPASETERAVFQDAPSSVHYLGKVDLQEKADAYAACDVFCMPSTSEILPTVYLEAWTHGKPVIGGVAEGLEELVTGNDSGVNVPQDPPQILAALEHYRVHPEAAHRHGTNGQRLVAEKYSVDAVGSQLENLYMEVIAQRASSGRQPGEKAG